MIWLNGGFVTAKDEPGDFNTCWDTDGVDLDALEPAVSISPTVAEPKAGFGGELFPNVMEAVRSVVGRVPSRTNASTSRKGIVVIHLSKGDQS